MEFMKLIDAKQISKKMSDSEVSQKLGISEYTYYNLKKHRIYLSKVAFFAFCGLFKLPIGSDEEIEAILKENKEKVGLPESNLYVAAEYVNPEYVFKLEQELKCVKLDIDKLSSKDKVINSQYKEIEKLNQELEELKLGLDKRLSEAYSNGVRESSSKLENMKQVSQTSFISALNEEYTDKIIKLEKALNVLEMSYYSLYKGVESGIITKSDDLYGFSKPLKLYKEQIGIDISEDVLKGILNNYYSDKLDVYEISENVNLSVELINKIIIKYKLVKKDGVVYIEKI